MRQPNYTSNIPDGAIPVSIMPLTQLKKVYSEEMADIQQRIKLLDELFKEIERREKSNEHSTSKEGSPEIHSH